ncbi:MAG TPA: hypothetical protein VKW08_07590 [Xanthobacteraceae bacterium]|nr:hypothetical protein [Xanthobacteraceae bacterium]
MKALPYAVAGLLLVFASPIALAASPVPSSEMPGRERDRFTQSPVERFMQPGPYQPPPVITPYTGPGCPSRKSLHLKSRSGRKAC